MTAGAPIADSALAHIEQFLGSYETTCDGMWWYEPSEPPGSPEENPYRYCVMRFRDQPLADLVTYVTVGASACELTQEHGNSIRMEFLLCAESSAPAAPIVSVLMGFTNAAMRLARAPFEGEVIEWKRPLFEQPHFRHLYVTHPILFNEKLALCENVSPPILVVELIPLSEREALTAIRVGAQFNRLIIESQCPIWRLDARDEMNMSEPSPRRVE